MLHISLDGMPFESILKRQITDLILICNKDTIRSSSRSHIIDVYAHILIFFENLTHLSVVDLSEKQDYLLSLDDLPPTTFTSSNLTQLRIKLGTLEDCLALLDGRLKCLKILVVTVYNINNESTTVENIVSFCFKFERIFREIFY